MKADKIYTERSLGEELYEVTMKIIPPQHNEPERRLKKMERPRASHMRLPKCRTTQEVSERIPTTNATCDTPVDNTFGTFSHKEELSRDAQQDTCKSSQFMSPTLDEALQRTHLDRLEEQVMNLLHAIDIHQNKPKLSQSWNASGKEKSNRTHQSWPQFAGWHEEWIQ